MLIAAADQYLFILFQLVLKSVISNSK